MFELPDTTTIEIESLALITQSKELMVVTHDDYIAAGEGLKEVKQKQKKVMELFAPLKEAAYKAHKAITAAEAKVMVPFKEAEATFSKKVTFYLSELRRKEQEEAARARREAESKAKAEAAERAEAMKLEEEKKKALAAQLEKQGFKEEAAAVISQEVVVQAPIAPVMPAPIERKPMVEGIHMRDNWQIEIVDLMALIQAIAEGKVAVQYLIPDLKDVNMKNLNSQAKALKEHCRIPGCRVYNDAKPVVKA